MYELCSSHSNNWGGRLWYSDDICTKTNHRVGNIKAHSIQSAQIYKSGTLIAQCAHKTYLWFDTRSKTECRINILTIIPWRDSRGWPCRCSEGILQSILAKIKHCTFIQSGWLALGLFIVMLPRYLLVLQMLSALHITFLSFFLYDNTGLFPTPTDHSGRGWTLWRSRLFTQTKI